MSILLSPNFPKMGFLAHALHFWTTFFGSEKNFPTTFRQLQIERGELMDATATNGALVLCRCQSLTIQLAESVSYGNPKII